MGQLHSHRIIRDPTWSRKNLIVKRKPKIAKLLPAVKFETPKLIVPKDVPQPTASAKSNLQRLAGEF